ncbi:ABC transporter ATP-binding protein [Actinomadura rugatobispora]|uniref:ABC transporter ATP-binding protein n=1 Tax=Actinomadura rugatobispora TaxID=1994 RepID=A0ABW0ZTX2_9ACTN|nr:ABC transporter ATP-binding protein [Actinomadura rugatobispora]
MLKRQERTPAGETLLEVRGLRAGYGAGAVVRDLDLTVVSGEVVALVGPNGAGKTTTLLTLAGELSPLAGEISFFGDSRPQRLHQRASRGLGLVTEERSVFMRLTTMENLRVGRCDIDYALDLFPELKSKLRMTAGLLSGGEQQMLTLARALSRSPRLLFVDELSLGLAPLAVDRLLTAVRRAADDGLGVLLVEQHVDKVLKLADTAIVLRRGTVEMAAPAAELRERFHEIEASYLQGGGRSDHHDDESVEVSR